MDRRLKSGAVPVGGLSISAMLIGLALGATPARAAERTATCAVDATAEGTVAAVTDERTLRLADGRQMRLAGLETIVDAGDAAMPEAAALRAKTELERLTLGRAVAIQSLGEERYGRRLALAVPATEPTGPTVQEHLIASGFALAATRSGPTGCVLRLLEVERRARAAQLGLWATPHYLLQEADRPEDVSVARGRFALVQGRVLSVNDRGTIVYVNLGRRWSEDFTVTIAKRNAGNFSAAGLDPWTLAGRRVRGWVGERGGPWIEAIGPEQIEFIY